MSRPAASCARRKHDTASSYCSRKRELTIASRKVCVPIVAVYQDGRGSDPMIEVGSITLAEALNMFLSRLREACTPRRAIANIGGPVVAAAESNCREFPGRYSDGKAGP